MESMTGWSPWGGWGGSSYAGGASHACALLKQPARPNLSPSAGFFRRAASSAADCLLPCAWHSASKLFLRSHKALMLERQRQMSSRCWCVIHPYSPFKFYWDCFVMLVFSSAFLYMPLQVFHSCPNPYDPYILFADGVAFVSIILNFITGWVDEDERTAVLEFRSIAKRYVVKDTFFIDVLAALPLQCITLYEDCTLPTHTLFYIVKLFRIIACGRILRNLAYQFGFSYVVAVTTAVFLRGVIFFHWMTYCHYQIPVLWYHTFKGRAPFEPWLRRVKALPVDGVVSTPLQKYISNLYYVSGVCIGAGVYSTLSQRALFLAEQMLIAIIGIIGLLFMTYSFTTLLRLVVYHHFESYIYNGRLKELHEYLAFKRLPKCIQQKIQLYINYRFNGHYFNENSILNTINEQIKQEINMFCCKKLVVNVPLFQNMPIALINTIIFSLTQVLYMPGEIVVKYGQPGSSIYLIASGTVSILNADGKEVGHLKDGAFFGERALLQPGAPRSATILALEITEIYKLNHAQLQACLQPVPRAPRRRAPPPPDSFPPHDTSPPPPHTDTSPPPPRTNTTSSPLHNGASQGPPRANTPQTQHDPSPSQHDPSSPNQ